MEEQEGQTDGRETQRGQHTLSVVTVDVITGHREADKLRRTT